MAPRGRSSTGSVRVVRFDLPILRPRRLFRRGTLKDDAVSGLVLGVESVPDGLASGLLAGVNPVAGMYGYLFGMAGGALVTSSTFMAVQATGAMSIIVADVGLGTREDPARSLFTLSVVTGAVMIAAGLLGLGSFLRFVSGSVMTGFVAAVGVNIVLGQLETFTGYDAQGGNRLAAAADLSLHLGQVHLPSVAVGSLTMALILVLRRTRLGALGLVVAVAAGSVAAAALEALGHGVAIVADVADVPRSLPVPRLPAFGEVPSLLVPAASLAFVGLVQGAGVSAGFPNPDRRVADPSQDFVGQGAGNVVSGIFQGMPVGGSMSASSLVVSAGARSRAALLFAAAVMALVIVLLADVVSLVAMPALAALLIVVGVGTVKPAKVVAVGRTGPVPLTVMSMTLVLTMIMPLQYAVLVGVGLSVLLFVIGQSSRLRTRRLVFREDGRIVETDPPMELPAGEVVALQPYGAVFFATAAVLREQMPTVTPASRRAVVILRLIVSDNPRLVAQLEDRGLTSSVTVYRGTDVVGDTIRQAYEDAVRWAADAEGGEP
jgi:SulP family sulfate permease